MVLDLGIHSLNKTLCVLGLEVWVKRRHSTNNDYHYDSCHASHLCSMDLLAKDRSSLIAYMRGRSGVVLR